MAKLSTLNEFSPDDFPIVYEQGKESAVLVDIVTFRKMQLIIENLIHRETEKGHWVRWMGLFSALSPKGALPNGLNLSRSF